MTPRVISDSLLAVRGALCPGRVPQDATWEPLSGGRSNAIWRVRTPEVDLVCKLYDQARHSPFFPNDPGDEITALLALRETGLAPEFLFEAATDAGCVVAYRFMGGTPVGTDWELAGQALARLHAQPVPNGLRARPISTVDILAEADTMLGAAAAMLGAAAAELREWRPAETPDDGVPVFLHGDPVPANLIRTDKAVAFIDWQCPGQGDASDDLAILFSPGMQMLYGAGPLEAEARDAVFRGYGDEGVRARYARRAPLLHWRLAAYCYWKAAQGDADYAPAWRAELSLVQELQGGKKAS